DLVQSGSQYSRPIDVARGFAGDERDDRYHDGADRRAQDEDSRLDCLSDVWTGHAERDGRRLRDFSGQATKPVDDGCFFNGDFDYRIHGDGLGQSAIGADSADLSGTGIVATARSDQISKTGRQEPA